MARLGARTDKKIAVPTYEQFLGIKHNCIDVDTAAEQIPNTNLSYRKGLIVQHGGSSGTLYIGGGLPYLIMGAHGNNYVDTDHDKRSLVWRLSGSGTNEWYLCTSSGGDPGLTEVTKLYYSLKATAEGSETAGTNGTVGSLAAAHQWDWGNNDTLGFNTVYIRSTGSTPAYNPKYIYRTILGYYFSLTADDTAATGGYELGPGDAVNLPLDGSVRLFAIGSEANIPVKTLEYV